MPWTKWKEWSLKCKNQNDRFTVNDTAIGNGNLSYSIGLVNADEVYLTGGYHDTNTKYYLYTGYNYWAMTPASYVNGNAIARYIDASGFGSNYDEVYESYGIKPVINLKANSLKSGDGTMENPYSIL